MFSAENFSNLLFWPCFRQKLNDWNWSKEFCRWDLFISIKSNLLKGFFQRKRRKTCFVFCPNKRKENWLVFQFNEIEKFKRSMIEDQISIVFLDWMFQKGNSKRNFFFFFNNFSCISRFFSEKFSCIFSNFFLFVSDKEHLKKKIFFSSRIDCIWIKNVRKKDIISDQIYFLVYLEDVDERKKILENNSKNKWKESLK